MVLHFSVVNQRYQIVSKTQWHYIHIVIYGRRQWITVRDTMVYIDTLILYSKSRSLHYKRHNGLHRKKQWHCAVRANTITVRDNGITVRDNGITVRDNGITVRYNGITVRDNGITVRDNGITVRDNGITVRDNGITVRDNGITVRDTMVLH